MPGALSRFTRARLPHGYCFFSKSSVLYCTIRLGAVPMGGEHRMCVTLFAEKNRFSGQNIKKKNANKMRFFVCVFFGTIIGHPPPLTLPRHFSYFRMRNKTYLAPTKNIFLNRNTTVCTRHRYRSLPPPQPRPPHLTLLSYLTLT